MRFNPPPNWPPFPADWTPGPDWQPDPSWPPAPPGWPYWVDDTAQPFRPPEADDQHRYAPPELRPPHISSRRKWLIAGGAALAVILLVAGGTVAVKQFGRGGTAFQAQAGETTTGPTAFIGLTFVPNHPAVPTDFTSWNRFGGIDATFSDNGHTVRLDTHDNVDTWKTKWSGLTRPISPACSLRVTGRVRDVSHTRGVAGGYGLGITDVAGLPGAEELRGSAVQYDFGQRGWRLTQYPSDSDSDLIAAQLDNDWHTIDVTITSAGAVSVDLDGKQAVRATTAPSCGYATIRVWAGAAEFADMLVGQ
ncbi:Uncharacterised protein [Mycobacteroides abscessus subsp. abscessus]|nr:Uncharacterised protein [Mycobacteroides abscessus subsp. abscessus]